MEVYSNENSNQQLNKLKDFLLRNSKIIVFGVVIGIVILIGWEYSLYRSNNLNRQSATDYGEIMEQLKQANPTDATLQQTKSFVEENQNGYGSLAGLELSKILVAKNDLAAAIKTLEQAAKDSKNPELLAILDIRLARLQFATGDDKAALATLAKVKGGSWQAMVSNIQGDIYAHQGEKQAAREAWSKGITSALTPALKQMMQTKLNNLG